MIGDRLGQFRIVGRLGAGGMSEVYRARDEQLDRDVAIKLPVGDLAEIDSRARLLHEARAAGGLNHPSICTIYMVGEADGMAFIAMELVDGQSLAEALRRGPLPIDRVLELGGQIADALAHAHAHHLVHRDLKSANVMLTVEGRAKVLDFGLARKTVDAEPNEATRVVTVTHGGAGAIVGTPAYMSPEQLCGEPADVRSDVWALGIVLYEMTTGRRPFAGHSSYEKATMFIAKALELDENLADLHVALGKIKATTEWNWAECEREYHLAALRTAGLIGDVVRVRSSLPTTLAASC